VLFRDGVLVVLAQLRHMKGRVDKHALGEFEPVVMAANFGGNKVGSKSPNIQLLGRSHSRDVGRVQPDLVSNSEVQGRFSLGVVVPSHVFLG